jgi:aminoglycoside phosphotransferase (APT) family kinase protein
MTVPVKTPTAKARPALLAPIQARPSDRLARARKIAPRIVAAHLGALPRCARRAVVSSAELTSTGLAIVVLAPVGEPLCCVIKMPMTSGAADRLERETAVLTALHADDRLGRWRALLPHPCAHGSVDGQVYRVDTALPGYPVLEPRMGADARATLLGVAADAIQVLHRATARTLPTEFDPIESWVEVHLRELERRAGRRRPTTSLLVRLRDELHVALAGQTFSASWIHGDYWLGNVLFGNLLFSTRGSMTDKPKGIVDWDASASLELPLHDLLHLLLYTRRQLTGRQLGHIVRDQMLHGAWFAEERLVLERCATWGDDESLSERHALLLYWLRHAAMHARQQNPHAGYRYILWERRNVLPVLAAL